MKQNKVCPKCNNKKILKIKDVLHSTGGGNISQSRLLNRKLYPSNNCKLYYPI